MKKGVGYKSHIKYVHLSADFSKCVYMWNLYFVHYYFHLEENKVWCLLWQVGDISMGHLLICALSEASSIEMAVASALLRGSSSS